MRLAVQLTKPQRLILDTAAAAPGGIVIMGQPDRKGCRVAGEHNGHPVIIAYQSPEYFLQQRGLLEHSDAAKYAYRITAEGRKARTFRRKRR
jgi:hypothetical protein